MIPAKQLVSEKINMRYVKLIYECDNKRASVNTTIPTVGNKQNLWIDNR